MAQCRTHRRAFTLYPLGHVPYGRLAVAPVTLDGQVVVSTQSEPAARDRQSPAWRATRLGAAFVAIDDPTVKRTDRRWWATQTPKRLGWSAALLGIHPGLAVPDAEAIAFRLDVPRLVLREATDAYVHARGRAGRGRVLAGVLDQLGADARLLDRILAAGAYAGCWGTVTRWDRASRGTRGQVFPGRGAPAGLVEITDGGATTSASCTAAHRLRRSRDRGEDPWPIADYRARRSCFRPRRCSATRSCRR